MAEEIDWQLEVAGQRVQIIKKTAKHGGVLEFGTELVCAEDASIVALLGASPRASTAVKIMTDLMKKCFSKQLEGEWKDKLKEMIPAFGVNLLEETNQCLSWRAKSAAILNLESVTP